MIWEPSGQVVIYNGQIGIKMDTLGYRLIRSWSKKVFGSKMVK